MFSKPFLCVWVVGYCIYAFVLAAATFTESKRCQCNNYYTRGVAIVTVGADVRLVLIFLISSLSRPYINVFVHYTIVYHGKRLNHLMTERVWFVSLHACIKPVHTDVFFLSEVSLRGRLVEGIGSCCSKAYNVSAFPLLNRNWLERR